MLYSSM